MGVDDPGVGWRGVGWGGEGWGGVGLELIGFSAVRDVSSDLCPPPPLEMVHIGGGH